MYGLKEDVDLTFFIKARLEQVCFGRFQIILNFTNDVSITMSCRFDVYEPVVSKASDMLASYDNNLLRLVGAEIESVEHSVNGTLRLRFDNGASLTIFDSEEGYESYVVNSRERVIVV